MARKVLKSLFTRHLFFTNVVSCGGLLSLGDCIVQNLENLHLKTISGATKPYDYRRTGRMFVIGLMMGPFNHHWYRLLDKFIHGSNLKAAVKKIAADQAVGGPFFCTTFLIGSGILEGKKIRDCVKEWREKFLTIYMADWCIWPPAQFINFYFFPPHLRVMYVCMVTLVWNTFLSYMKHRDQHAAFVHKQKEEASC
ncbi:mpv17-like protein 2 [Babylonia areolata]|uniref:mpv17-like protein 2 n=1 Tax=Babylonia areolata TaxID=304850 RepID=UPI003FD37F42